MKKVKLSNCIACDLTGQIGEDPRRCVVAALVFGTHTDCIAINFSLCDKCRSVFEGIHKTVDEQIQEKFVEKMACFGEN
jgi:hypothetical protein